MPGTVWTGDREPGQGGGDGGPPAELGECGGSRGEGVLLTLAMLGCSRGVDLLNMFLRDSVGGSGGAAEGERE